MSEGAASTFLTVSTNIIVTSLITFRLVRARRALVKILPAADVHVYTGVIAILVESAAPLAIFGIIAAIFQELSGSAGLFYSFSGLSPHMIIFRVTTGRSFTDFPSPGKNGILSNHIQFARQTAESSFLQSTLNRELGRTLDQDTELGFNSRDDNPTSTQGSIVCIAQEEAHKAEEQRISRD
ncbi:hypothetical protein MD484_g5199, partial [Candolleomyces efflorescens]